MAITGNVVIMLTKLGGPDPVRIELCAGASELISATEVQLHVFVFFRNCINNVARSDRSGIYVFHFKFDFFDISVINT